jgi:transcriptional regulator with XRE-family HTH domain
MQKYEDFIQNHEDLKAARTLALLSQQEAADKLGVSREHYCRLEKGKQALTRAKYLKFLETIGKTQADIDAHFANLPAASLPPARQITDLVVEEYIHGLPRPRAEALCASILRKHPQPAAAKLEYDRKGYPLNVGPFDAVEFSGCGFGDHAEEIDEALIEIEGAEFPARSRARRVKYTERRWPNNKDEDHLQERAKDMRKWDAENAAWFARLALNKGWPVDKEKAKAAIDAEQAANFAEALARAERLQKDIDRRKLEATPEYKARKAEADKIAAEQEAAEEATRKRAFADWCARTAPVKDEDLA